MTQLRFPCLILLSALAACNSAGTGDESTDSSAGVTPGTTTGTQSAAGTGSAAPSVAGSSGAKTGSAAAGSTATTTAPQRAVAGSSGSVAAASAGAPAAAGGAGAAGSGTVVGTAGAGAAGSAGSVGAAGAAGAAGGDDLTAAAKGFAELFLDAPCDSEAKAPLEQGATCNHPPMTQHIEKMVMFGGETGKKYKVTLRIRGIWEPTQIMGGMRPVDKQPFTVGGMVMGGSGSSSDAINYQQYYIEVADPKQTYWLNDYQYVAHDIHKQDYEAAVTISGGTAVKVVMNDGNEREIANFPKEMFSDFPPYDKMPSLGQSLRLDVVKVEVSP